MIDSDRPEYYFRMHSIVQRLRASWFLITITLLACAVRSLASIGQPIARFPDSAGYEHLSLWGTVDRFWPVPLLYWLVQADVGRIIVHIVVGVAAWTSLGLVVSRIVRWPKSVFTLIMFLGLTPQVIRYDITLLSESLGISFAIGAIAATINVCCAPTTRAYVLWIITLAFCAMTRPTHLVVIAVALFFIAFQFIRFRHKKHFFVLVALLFLCLISLVQLRGHKSTSILNFYTVLSERVITNDQRYGWFVKQGMPNIEGARGAVGYDYAFQLPRPINDIVQLPIGQNPPTLMRVGGIELARWVDKHGWSHYAQYLIVHPSDTMQRLSSLLDETLSPPSTDFLPLENGPMLPEALFLHWSVWLLLCIAGITLCYLQNPLCRIGHVFVAMFLATTVIYAASTLTSGIEHPRHGVTVAVVLRVMGVLALVVPLGAQLSTTTRDEDAVVRD